LKSPARYLVPMSFVVATLVGSVLHIAEANLPMTETIVAVSVLLGGGLLVLRKDLSGLLLSAMSALFGVFHGYAYGESIIGAESTPLLAYLIGFAIIQYAIIVGFVYGLSKFAIRFAGLQEKAQRIGGTFALCIGGLFMALSFS
jgi:urease accessory protein